MTLKAMRLWGRKLSGAYKNMLADDYEMPGFHVVLRPTSMNDNNAWAITTSWAQVVSLDDKFLLTEIQVLNPTGGPISFWLAHVETGQSYAAGDEILADGCELAAGSTWIWQGRKSKVTTQIYVKGSANGLVMRSVGEEIWT